ncbi:MAG TPA: endonuclease domain-containing protein [Steroidobacteraceae bacterium]|nr:endonuclease domain-containing protein [Steroidobacteraceae bacterium]
MCHRPRHAPDGRPALLRALAASPPDGCGDLDLVPPPGPAVHELRFRRQHPIGPYFADFACLDVNLIIELDGGQHNTGPGLRHDGVRTEFLASRGFVVLRFWDNDVLRTPMAVLGAIAHAVQTLRKDRRSPYSAVPATTGEPEEARQGPHPHFVRPPPRLRER